MVRSIDGRTVYGNKIVPVVAALDMDAGVEFAAGLYAGKQPDETQRVGIAHQGGQFRQTCDIDPAGFRTGGQGRSAPAGGHDCAVDQA